MATITVFDDPLDPYGWALQPAVRRLAVAFPDVERRIRAVPLADSWDDYGGPEIRGGKAGMAATCAQVSEESGMPIDEYLWFDDAPGSPLPGCRAVAGAAVAGPEETDPAARAMRALREATFIRRVNVATDEGLRATLSAVPGVDAEAVTDAMADGRADGELDAHRGEARSLDAAGIRRAGDRPVLPTVVVADGEDARAVSGQANYARYREAVEAVTGTSPVDERPSVGAALERFSPEGWVAARELSELADRPYDDAVAAAREVEGIVERSFASEPFFRTAEYVEGEADDGAGEGGDDGDDDDGQETDDDGEEADDGNP